MHEQKCKIVDPKFDPKQKTKQEAKQGTKKGKDEKAASKKRTSYGYSGDIKKPAKKHATRSSKKLGDSITSTSQQSQDIRNDGSDDDFMEPPPQLPALRYVHPPPRSKSKPAKLKKPKKKASAHSSDENDFDEIMNSSEEEPEDGNSGKGSDKPRK